MPLINDNQDNLEELIDRLTFAYNTATHKTTNITPFELMFGRQSKIPIEKWLKDNTERHPRRPYFLGLQSDV